jgi:hypothetical protein
MHREERRRKGAPTGGRAAVLALLVLALGAAPALAVTPELPPEGRCPDWTSLGGPIPGGDGTGPVFAPGDVLDISRLLALRGLLPAEIWSHREEFFYEGMRLEVGDCNRRYPTASFYEEASQTFKGRARLDEDGNLLDYEAGLPFAWEGIDSDDPEAGMKWAWNFQQRYRGAGPVGQFRIFDLPSGRTARLTAPQTYIGNFFVLQTGHRSDLAANGFQVPESTTTDFIAGGRFEEPFDARHLAWRQMRSKDALEDWKQADNTFVYIPELRKIRRAASGWIDGVYTPRYTVTGQSDAGTTGFATGGSARAPDLGSVELATGKAVAATEDIRRGFTGLALRPNAYKWRVLGYKEVLTPLNGAVEGWPENSWRNYGPSGLAVSSDRWDLRYAVVLEGLALREVEGVARIKLWIDVQTQQPLYFISFRKEGFLLEVGTLVHRFSGDTGGYPAWPSGEPANVFDPVAAAFLWIPGGGSGWRRESYDARSVPLDPKELRHLTSTDSLMRGH